MYRFLHWDRDKECILFIEQKKFDFALQGRGGPAAGRAPARGGDLFLWREKKTPPPRLGFFFFFSLSIYIKKNGLIYNPDRRGGLHTTFFPVPQSTPFFYVLYIHIAHTQTHSDDYAHSIIHKSFRVYLGNIRPSTRYYVCMIPAALHTI